MAKGRQRAEWERTAQVSALLANPYRDPRKAPRTVRAMGVQSNRRQRAAQGKETQDQDAGELPEVALRRRRQEVRTTVTNP